MAFLSRLYDFTPSTLIQSSQVDEEFQQLVDILGGGEVATQVKFTHSGSTTGVEVDNTGGGILQIWKVAGVAKAKINVSGQIESLLTTGTAPLVVASTTMVSNLNAEQVGGKVGTNLVQYTDESGLYTGNDNPQIKLSGAVSATLELDDSGEAGLSQFRIRNVAGDILFQVYDDVSAWADIMKLDMSASEFQDSAGSKYASEAHVAARKSTWSFGVFYAGAIGTTVKQAIWIIPNDEDLMTVTRVRWLFQSGSPTGTSQIKLQHKNSAGTQQNTQTFSILVGDTAGQSYDVDVSADWNMASGDYLEWSIIADGGHQDISIHAQGEQSIY